MAARQHVWIAAEVRNPVDMSTTRRRAPASARMGRRLEPRHRQVRDLVAHSLKLERDFLTGSYDRWTKTKPLRVEELQPIADWWGQESDGFKDRVETEQAWKVDFKKRKEDAEAKAKPHWDKAETLNNQAAALNEQAKELRASIKGEKKADLREKVDAQIEKLSQQIDRLRQQAKDEQATGDRHYWPIYNLDLKNPNAPEEESHDPDALLAKYQKLIGEIEQTQNQLRDELAAALAHHFESEESAS